MANEMIKFLRGNVANLPKTATSGALYFTKDEGVYLGLEDGSYHRYGDFITVADVKSLPATGAHATCMYYCTAENILARYDSAKGWIQINKQPTAEEMKTLLGLGTIAYKSEVAESDLSAALAEKVNAASEGNHAHLNKGVLDGITAEKVAAWDAAEQNAKDYADDLDEAMDTRVKAVEAAIGENGSVATQIKTAIEALDYTDVAVDGEYVSAVNEVDGKISVTRKALPDYTNTYDAKGAANTAYENAKAYADGLASNYDEKGAAAGVKTELEAEISKKVDKVEGKSLIADTEITRLATLANYDDTQVKADIAKKADAETMTTELGKKVDKVEGYSLVSDTEIARLAGIVNYDDTALIGRVTTAEGKITALETESAKHALKTEVEAEFAKYTKTADLPTDLGDFTNDAGYAKTSDVNTELDKKADKTQVATDIANAIAPLATTGALNGVKATAEAAAVATEVEAALALKADKSVVDAMYTNTQIDGFIAEAKKYADDNDADTKYGIVYDSDNKKIKLVEGGSEVEIDASAFIKDGMISNVTIGDDNDLVITFNTDAGKENIVLPLDQLVDIYTGVEGNRIKVTVNADKSISADIVAGSIGKDCLDAGVKASLALADSAIQTHQDISHLATTEALNGVDAKFANYTNTIDMNAKFDLKADKTQVATDIATAKGEAATDAQTKVDALANGQVKINTEAIATKANAADVYTKAQTYTQDEVDALIGAAHQWGEF